MGRVGKDLKSGKEVGGEDVLHPPRLPTNGSQITLRIAGQGNPDEHPYNDLTTSLSCPYTNKDSIKNLGQFIAYFEDGPKSRFIG